jgi:hypothetical protein
MKTTLITAAVLAVGFIATAASAAPIVNAAPGVAADSGIVQIHNGYHRSCELGERGWHYNTPRDGRVECRPRRPIGLGWIWLERDGRRGWYHERRRSWH